jgi:hypothetical protein
MFAAEYETVGYDGRRRTQRTPAVGVSEGTEPEPTRMTRALCKVVDVTRHNCRIQTYSGLEAGQVLQLTLPEVGAVSVVVIWADDFFARCRFRPALAMKSMKVLAALNR